MSHVAADRVDVILRDGSTLRLDTPTGVDAAAVRALFESLSPESRYARFHGYGAIDDALVLSLLDPDWEERGALVGRIGEADDERVVAVANYVRLREYGVAEVAFTVADDFQGRGIGTRLLEQLAARAAQVGIERFVAMVLPGNEAMLSVIRDVGLTGTRKLQGGIIEATLEIEADEEFRSHVDLRDHLGVVASLVPFFRPRSVAVIGASPRADSIGGAVFRNVLAADFAGCAYPVNRDGHPVAGVRAYRSVSELPEPVDLAVIAIPADRVLDVAEEALAQGTRALVVISAGFAETGEDGLRRQEELLSLVRAHGARLIGPNCLGIFSAAPGLNATFAARVFPPGRIGFSSQSGALGLALLERASARGLGFSGFVSIGNKADVSSNDLLEWWETDDETSLVLLYVESFGNPQKFGRIARRLARRKPILAIKSGRTAAGSRAAGSHTAAMSSPDAVAAALFSQAGVIRADTLAELLDAAALLSSQPLPAGPRVAVVTNAGGLGILCADACGAAGLELPHPSAEASGELQGLLPEAASIGNPIDMLGSASAEEFRRACEIVLRDPTFDAVIALFVATRGVEASAVGTAISAAAATVPAKPTLACLLAEGVALGPLRGGAEVPSFAYPEAAAAALAHAVARAAWLRRPAGIVDRPRDIDGATARRVVESALARGEAHWLTGEETWQLLRAYGLTLVDQSAAVDGEDAVKAATALGFPVVVKTAAAGAHKTELGGVAVDLETPEEVRAAAERIGGPLLVQRQVTGGSELLAGVLHDPTFGSVVSFGPGGILTELIGGVDIRIAPLTDVDIAELLDGDKTRLLVAGYRGRPATSRDALADLLSRLSALATDHPHVLELDLNPVIGTAAGAVIVDARIRIGPLPVPSSTKSW
jgi:acetyl coenzyme A synthetase (ADP forming)-like protein